MTEQEFHQRMLEAYGSGFSSPGALRAAAAAALAASADGASRTDQPARWLALGSAVFIAAAVVATMLAAGALHRAVTPAPSASHRASLMPQITTNPVPPASQVISSESVSWAQAQADSPDLLLVPGWLPSGHYLIHRSVVQEVKGPDGRATVTITDYRSLDGRSVLVTQYHQQQISIQVPGPSTSGTVGDQPATFYEYVDGTPTAVTWQLPDGNYVDIITAGLTAEEMTRVAIALHA
jgi:hypothetical protein